MKVFLDDVRQPADIYPNETDWVLVATAQQAIDLLMTFKVSVISLDHDLGSDENGTGYDVIKWIEEQVFTNGFKPPAFKIHSANPVGRCNMERGIERLERWLDVL